MAAAAVVLVGRSAVRSVKPRFTYLHTGTAHTLHDSPHRGPCCYLDAGFTRRRRAPVLAVEDFRAVQDRHRASENRAMVAGPVAPPRHVLPPPPRRREPPSSMLVCLTCFAKLYSKQAQCISTHNAIQSKHSRGEGASRCCAGGCCRRPRRPQHLPGGLLPAAAACRRQRIRVQRRWHAHAAAWGLALR